MKQHVGAIILAAGRGKRMGSAQLNKVVYPLKGKPMITYTIRLLNELKISPIIVVVGYAKESVQAVLGDTVEYAFQKQQRGTADAVSEGLKKLPESISHVLVLNGDDSAGYPKSTMQSLISKHLISSDTITFMTTQRESLQGIGRIVRTKDKKLVKIVEENDASTEEKMIREINVGCYMFSVNFLKDYLPRLEKSSKTGEYYLTSLINLALCEGLSVETLFDPKLTWYGVNTQEDLQHAEVYYS